MNSKEKTDNGVVWSQCSPKRRLKGRKNIFTYCNRSGYRAANCWINAANIFSTAIESDQKMIDSGTTAHMKPKSETVKRRSPCKVSISLGDDFTVSATKVDIRKVFSKMRTDQ